jgi:hypothetical protein
MIARYNSKQIAKALLALVGGLFSYYLAYLFFRYLPAFVAWNFHIKWTPETAKLAACLCLVLITISGYRTWKGGGGFNSYHESAFFHDLGEDSAYSVVADYYASKLTGPAYYLSQLFVSGPLYLLSAVTLMRSILPNDPELEHRLKDTLTILKSANKWQAITDYPLLKQEILNLAQMDLIDFSAKKGIPRIKAH